MIQTLYCLTHRSVRPVKIRDGDTTQEVCELCLLALTNGQVSLPVREVKPEEPKPPAQEYVGLRCPSCSREDFNTPRELSEHAFRVHQADDSDELQAIMVSAHNRRALGSDTYVDTSGTAGDYGFTCGVIDCTAEAVDECENCSQLGCDMHVILIGGKAYCPMCAEAKTAEMAMHHRG